MKRKLLAGFMAVCLILTLLPATALAAETALPEPDDGVITLTDDVEIPSSVAVTSSDLTIDLNGHTLKTAMLDVASGASLTLTDTSENENGKLTTDGANTAVIRSGGTLILEGGTIENTFEGGNAVFNMGTLTVKDGTVQGETCVYNTAWNGTTFVEGKIVCNIKGGTVDAGIWGVCVMGPGVQDGDLSTVDNDKLVVNISGGTIKVGNGGQGIAGNASSGKRAGFTVNMTGGSIQEADEAACGMYLPGIGITNISGGSITAAQAIRICAGELNVTGGTITCTAVSDGEDLIAGGSGGTLGAIVVGKASTGYVGDIDVNVSGSAVIKNVAQSEDPNAVYPTIVVSDKNMALDSEQTIPDPATGADTEGTFNYSETSTTVTVNAQVSGDIVKISNISGGNTQDGGDTSLEITGGTVAGNVINQTTAGDVLVTNAAVTGAVKNSSTSGAVTVVGSSVGSADDTVSVVDSSVGGSEPTTTPGLVAMIGAKTFEDLQDAIDAAQPGETVKLVADVTLSGGAGNTQGVITIAKKDIILDGNNFKLTAAGVKADTSMINVQYTNGETVTIKNLKIDSNGEAKHGININEANVSVEAVEIVGGKGYGIVCNGSTLSVNGLTTSGNEWGGINVDSKTANASKLTVESATINEANSIYMEHGAGSVGYPMSVTVESGTFQSISAAGATQSGDEITIKGGTITNVANAGAGSVDITGGTITNVSGDVDVSGGTVTGNVDIKPDDGECVIIYKIDGETVYARGQSVDPDNKSTDRWTKDLPTNPGYSLTSWTSENPSVTAGTRSDDGKSVWLGVEAGKTYVFNAYWTYNTFDSDRPSSGGSSVSTGDYGVSVSGSKHGDVSVSPNRADEGDTVTITAEPDRGYEVGEVTVTDKNGDEIRVRDRGDGEYTFTMPDGRVTVKVTFVEERAELPFVDVASDAYYYDAVAWAVENGITGGTTPTTFAPGNPCTRAQTVTFLWRAAGMPQAANRVNPFTDVSESDYYYEAVLWAVENGITSGTTATTFGPSTTCTRAQVATFLWRYSKEDASTLPMFTDVAESDYYYGAVAWAVENGVTQGVTETAFQPGNPCTRGQIVTFLYRYMGE